MFPAWDFRYFQTRCGERWRDCFPWSESGFPFGPNLSARFRAERRSKRSFPLLGSDQASVLGVNKKEVFELTGPCSTHHRFLQAPVRVQKRNGVEGQFMNCPYVQRGNEQSRQSPVNQLDCRMSGRGSDEQVTPGWIALLWKGLSRFSPHSSIGRKVAMSELHSCGICWCARSK